MGFDTAGQLGRYLKALREKHGYTQAGLSAVLSCSQGKINKLESGETRVNPADLRVVVAELRAHGPEADEMIALAVDLEATHRRQARLADERSTQFRKLRGVEAEADEILALTGDRFPGLVQAEVYMRHLFASDDLGGIEARVAARTKRAELFDRTPAPHLRVLLGEGALVRLVRSRPADVASAQLLHLADVAARPTVHLRVVAFDADLPVLPPDFTVLCFQDGQDNFGYQETPVDARIISKKADVAALIGEWHEVADKALSEEDSLLMVKEAASTLP